LTGVDLGAIAPPWQVVATADYNADGYTDIIWHNSQTGQVQLWLMGSFSGPANSAPPATTTIDVTGDVTPFAALKQPAIICPTGQRMRKKPARCGRAQLGPARAARWFVR
jgi:hypothetical protein